MPVARVATIAISDYTKAEAERIVDGIGPH